MITRIGVAVLALCLIVGLAGCGIVDRSPPIVCEVGGQLLETGFTFNRFKGTVAREHGAVEAEPNVSIRSRSVEVYFKTLDDGRLLAERAFWVRMNGTKDVVDPAVLFDLAKAPVVDTNSPAMAL